MKYFNKNKILFSILLLTYAALVAADDHAPVIGEPVLIVPSPQLPDEAIVNTSNNNLDVIMHQGALYFAWRTSTSHFASGQTLLQVMKQLPDGEWQFELAIATGKDLREPRFLSFNGELFLYFAELGTNPLAFEPGRTLFVKKDQLGAWSDTQLLFANGFIPWRINWVDGVPVMIGYQGGENIYQDNQTGLSLMLLTTHDGVEWVPAYNEGGVVLESGLSETDFIVTDDYWLAVGRNEAGDEDGWGSKICRADRADPGYWECKADFRKFDSPLMLQQNGQAFLIARRQVAYGGHYDLNWRRLSFSLQNVLYQAFYWFSPKRCAVWAVDADKLSVEWLADLPSAGDTCFPSAIEQEDGSFDIYNYSSDPDTGAAWPWLKGQLNPTHIYKINVNLVP